MRSGQKVPALPALCALAALGSCAGFAEEDKMLEPSGLWHLNGNGNDSTKNGNHGKATGAYWGEGRYGKGLWLYGEKDSYLLAPHSRSLDATSALSIGLWVKPAGSPARVGGRLWCVVGKPEKPDAASYGIFFDPAERTVVFQVKVLGEVAEAGSHPVGSGWHYVALVYDGDEVRGYVDGKLAGKEAAPGEIGPETEEQDSLLPAGGGDIEDALLEQSVGGAGKTKAGTTEKEGGAPLVIGGHGFRGEIDEARIYRTALTQKQLIACAKDAGPLPCRLEVAVTDEASARPLEARVHVTTADGKHHGPRDTLYYEESDHRFYTSGNFKLDLAPGKVHLTVCRGLQYEVKELEIDLKPGTKRLSVPLKRWIDLGAKGWYGGDGQIQSQGHGEGEKYWGHFPHLGRKGGGALMMALTTIACKAEGYDWAPEHYAKRGLCKVGNGENWTQFNGHTDFVTDADPEVAAMRNEMMGPWYYEAGGCGTFFNILRYEIMAEHGGLAYPAHPRMGPFDNPFVASGWGHNRERVIDFALGRAHVVGAGMFDEGCRYLNLGFRIGFLGETDAYMNWAPGVGGVTTFVKARELTAANLVRGILDGKTVVTYGGPFIEIRVNGKGVGETLALEGKAPETVDAEVEAYFWPGIDRIEIVRNGEIVATAAGNGERALRKKLSVPVNETCYLLAKCYGRPSKWFGTFAHTSPIYIRFGDTPIKVNQRDVEFFLDYLARLRKLFQQYSQLTNQKRYQAGQPQLTAERLRAQGIDPDAKMDHKVVAFYHKLIDKSEEVFRSVGAGQGPNFKVDWRVWIEELDDR